MHSTIEFLLRHGYVVLLGWVFAEQIGVPIPSLPLLLAAGALAGTGRMSLFLCLFLAMVAAVSADFVWYRLGRAKGIKILQLLCKISLEPDSCVRRTQGVFSKNGARSLLFCKFVPGLNTVAPPLAGIFHMKTRRFLLFDAMGTLLYGGTFIGLGYLFSNQIEKVAQALSSVGGGLGTLLLASLAGYIAWKFMARQRFLRQLRISRISVEELKHKLDSGEALVIVDLRHSMDFEAEPETIPGAFRMDAKELQEKNDRLPQDREVILYCT